MRGAGRGWGGDALALAILALLAVGYVAAVVVPRARAPEGIPHFDTYAYFYPNAVYALEALGRGESLLWNRFQNCGQPFLAITLVALLYPLHWLVLALGIEPALFALFAAHLLIGGAGTYGLGRALRLRPAAALSGALIFELGWTTLYLGYWSPMTLAVYAWMPGALAATEALLRRATRRRTALLAVLLGLQWLAGYPQVSVFTYQLIALRAGWEAVTRWRPRLSAGLLAIALASLLAPALAAVQVVPGIEVAHQSLRNRVLTDSELRPPLVTTTWEQWRERIGQQLGYGAIVTVGTAALAGLAAARRGRRRIAACYALAAALGVALAFDSPLFALYRHLPFGSAFREPNRFVWVTAFAACVLAAVGVDGLLRGGRRDSGRWRHCAAASAALLAMAWLTTSPLQWRQRLAAVVAFAATAATAWRPARRALVLIAPALIALELLFASGWQMFTYLAEPSQVWQQRQAFEQVRARLTAQDRMYQVASVASAGWGGVLDGVLKKAGQLYRLPSIVDYEPQTSARYAELVVRMLWGAPMQTINQFYFDIAYVPQSRPLFDLTAARFVVIERERTARAAWPGDGFALRWENAEVRLYENLQALPRARFVPRALVFADPAALLEALAAGAPDPRSTVLLEGSEAGALGAPGAGGTAEIVADHGARLTVRVRADGAGFLVLTDQHYPGWRASVNGAAAPIRRADYAFRAVAVPAGDSVVEFTYAPLSVRLGAAISALASVALLVVVLWPRFRRDENG